VRPTDIAAMGGALQRIECFQAMSRSMERFLPSFLKVTLCCSLEWRRTMAGGETSPIVIILGNAVLFGGVLAFVLFIIKDKRRR
jgi:hypothetical protein